MQEWTLVLLCGVSFVVAQRYNAAINVKYPSQETDFDFESLPSTVAPDLVQNIFNSPPVETTSSTAVSRDILEDRPVTTDLPDLKFNSLSPQITTQSSDDGYLSLGKILTGEMTTAKESASETSSVGIQNNAPESPKDDTVESNQKHQPPLRVNFVNREDQNLRVSVQTRNFSTSNRSSEESRPLEMIKLSPDHPYNLNRINIEIDNRNHPCRRDCQGDTMLCYFYLELEHFQTMSKACYDCPYNVTDCYRPDCITADGVKRSLLVFNRTLPGPTIEVCQGDRVVVDVHNLLGEGTTAVHWHGQHQRGTPYMDGVPHVTQCPVSSHSSFRYDFIAANPGTHFYHSHAGTQRADGAFGSMIVRRQKSEEVHSHLYDEDLSEHKINIIDWSHQLGVSVFTAHYHSDGDNKPPTLLVNGQGVWANYTRNGTTFHTPYESFTVEKGVRYRFRLINAGVLNCPVQLSVDNHTITAISADSFDIEPKEVDALVSYAGERWDFILNANQPIGNYWIRFRGLMDCDQRFTAAHQGAVLHYDGANGDLPPGPLTYELSKRRGLVLNPLNKDCDDHLCVTSLKAKAPKDRTLKKDVDKKLVFAYDFHPKNHPRYHKEDRYGFDEVLRKRNRVYTPQLNHVSLILPPFPLLSQYEDIRPGTLCDPKKLTNCETEWCECTNVIDISMGQVVEIILIDIGETYDANHPFHLHGHAFRVVGMARLGNETSREEVEQLDREGKISRNLDDPVIKDTVTVPDGGYTIVRFVADNPGYWMFHCHIDFHVEVGMAVLLKVGEHSDFPPPPKHFPKCGDFLPPLTENVDPTTNQVPIFETSTMTSSSSIADDFESASPASSPKIVTTSSENPSSQNEIVPSELVYNATKVATSGNLRVPTIIELSAASNARAQSPLTPLYVLFAILKTSFFLR